MPVGSLTLEELNADLKAHLTNGKALSKEEEALAPQSFPIEVFPLKLQQFIRGSEVTEGRPSEFLAASILFAVSAAIGRTHLLELKKHSRHTGLMFLCLVGHPNSNKTSALSAALKPIKKRDTALYEDYKRDMAEYEVIQEMSKKERIEAGITEVKGYPVLKKIIIQDATQEAVVKLHEHNLRGLALHRDELLGWIKSFNRYSSGGEEEFWLSAWSGEELVKDRTTSRSIRVDESYIPVAGTIQPDVLNILTKNQRGKNGFIDRLIFVHPGAIEKPDWSLKVMPDELMDHYNQGINKLLNLTFDEQNKPHVIKLDRACQLLLIEFFNNDNKVECIKAQSNLLKRMYGKFDIYALRFCLLLQMMWWAFDGIEKDQVDPAMVKRAIQLTRYFRHNAYRIAERVEHGTPVDELPVIKQKVYEALPRVFKSKDGIILAARFGLHRKTFRRMLEKKSKLFRQTQRGEFEKLY